MPIVLISRLILAGAPSVQAGVLRPSPSTYRSPHRTVPSSRQFSLLEFKTRVQMLLVRARIADGGSTKNALAEQSG